PLLKDIIQNDDDVLLRRAAAVGLRQLQTPESIPVMEHILANAGDDRFVRLSAAYGLAESGRPLGVTGLAQFFPEPTADGRGRDGAPRERGVWCPRIEGCHGFAGAPRARGVWGAISGPPILVDRVSRGATASPGRPERGGYGGPFRGPPSWLTAYRGVPRLRR